MNSDKRSGYVMRSDVLALLSDDEVAAVSTAETSVRLSDGDEYLDLEALEAGVRRAGGAASPMGRVLPRKAVQPGTWTKILTHLAAPRA